MSIYANNILLTQVTHMRNVHNERHASESDGGFLIFRDK